MINGNTSRTISFAFCCQQSVAIKHGAAPFRGNSCKSPPGNAPDEDEQALEGPRGNYVANSNPQWMVISATLLNASRFTAHLDNLLGIHARKRGQFPRNNLRVGEPADVNTVAL